MWVDISGGDAPEHVDNFYHMPGSPVAEVSGMLVMLELGELTGVIGPITCMKT
jgi:hypothetical protein